MSESSQNTLENEMFESFLRGKNQEFFIEYDADARARIFESHINSLSNIELLQAISQTLEAMSLLPRFT